jgi:hypothetical protein
MLRSLDVWFGAVAQVIRWFRKGRGVRFARVEAQASARKGGELGGEATAEFIDIPWNGKSIDELELRVASQVSATLFDVAGSSLS